MCKATKTNKFVFCTCDIDEVEPKTGSITWELSDEKPHVVGSLILQPELETIAAICIDELINELNSKKVFDFYYRLKHSHQLILTYHGETAKEQIKLYYSAEGWTSTPQPGSLFNTTFATGTVTQTET